MVINQQAQPTGHTFPASHKPDRAGEVVTSEQVRSKSVTEQAGRDQAERDQTQLPLCQRYQLALLDLDGVVYLSGQVIAGAAQSVQAARAAGMQVGFVTNNASRTALTVAQNLCQLGVQAAEDDVVTSAQAGAAVLQRLLPAEAVVLVVGAPALEQAVREVGLRPVRQMSEQPAALVQGFSPTMDWPQLTQAMLAINSGLPWVLTNDDMTIPTAEGIAPGNGAFAAMLTAATAATPVAVAGKPNPEHMQLALQHFSRLQVGAGGNSDEASIDSSQALFVGDRLDTDMAGAASVGMDSLAVLTGVSTPMDLVCAEQALRPTYVAQTLSGLTQPLVPISALAQQVSDGQLRYGGWKARLEGSALRLSGQGSAADATAAACALAWPAADNGHPVTNLSVLGQLH